MTEEILELDVTGAEAGQESLVVRLSEPLKGPDTAPMVLYLHGFGSDQWGEKASYFRQKILADGLGCCSLDFQGHGRSGGGMLDLTLSRQLADVQIVSEMLESRGYPRHIVFGSSMGGLTGPWHAALHPDRVLVSACIAPALSLGSHLSEWAGVDGMRRWREEGTIRVDNEIGSWELGRNFVADLGSYPVSRLQELTRRPSLILQGKLDDRVDWRRVMDFVVGCEFEDQELHLFADGDHRLVDRKKRLWRLVHDYLQGKNLLP
jgi:pimeloyl-ACP methyl ester carboxylesterase